MKNPNELKPETLMARAGVEDDPVHGAVMPPLFMSTNYAFEGYGKKGAYEYSRKANPTRDLLGRTLATLDGGHDSVVTATGMAALDLAFHLLDRDDLLIAPQDCFGGTIRLLEARAGKGHFRVHYTDLTDPVALAEAFDMKPAMVLIETPSNPLLRVTDIAAVTALARMGGALTVVDNTFLTPVLQRPIALGADIVAYSTTKYLNGHSDVVGGALVSAKAEIHEKLFWWANCLGVTGSAFDSYLTLRGLRTLGVRIRHQERSAARIAQFLAGHPAIGKVCYPGLEDSADYPIARKQQDGFGAMLSFSLRGGVESVKTLLEKLDLFSLAESLGGVESLVAHPSTMTHASLSAADQARAGFGEDLLRLSIGLEDSGDLVADLDRALSDVL